MEGSFSNPNSFRNPIQPFRLREKVKSPFWRRARESKSQENSQLVRCGFLLTLGAIQLVLLIIIENAVRYTPSGGKIEMRLSNGAGCARIEIRDSGIGIRRDCRRPRS
ncbi:MAG: hypothetical protein DMG49_17655 [Acidobacteria bacterium]|nr:MAG: hypothetical protein DMG49_17655 [Acidobacteriota bacterium]